MGHLPECDLEAFFSDRLTPARRRQAVRQLLAGCAPRLVMPVAAAEGEVAYDACIGRALTAVRGRELLWREERERRERGLALVRSKGWASLTRVERLSLGGGWAEVEVLLAICFEARYRDPQEMLRLARKAKSSAERLDAARYGERPVADLRARASAELGNALRVNERFAEAGEALRRARSLLEEGAGDPMVRARIDDIEASLRKDQRRLDEAEALLARVYRQYLRLGERHLAGRTLLGLGTCRVIAGQPLEAARFLRQAVALLDVERDPQLAAAAHHNLIDSLAEAGKFREAGQLLLQSGLRRKFAGDPLNLVRLRWLEGKILAGRGRLADAERVLSEARASFRAHGLELVAALAGVDLARVLLQKEELDRLHALTRELHRTACDQGLQTAASNALVGLEVVCRFRVATVTMVDNVRRFLHRLQYDPGLPWKEELILSA